MEHYYAHKISSFFPMQTFLFWKEKSSIDIEIDMAIIGSPQPQPLTPLLFLVIYWE
jgi:hypothetical protein